MQTSSPGRAATGVRSGVDPFGIMPNRRAAARHRGSAVRAGRPFTPPGARGVGWSATHGHEVYASQDTFRDVAKALEAKFGEPRKAALTWKPQNTVAVDDETGEKLLKLIDLLNEHDDVQNVYANFEVSDALMAKMGA